ncbi:MULTISPECIES: site-specific integrase [Flavobacteriaceae]|jgi:integrase|uniref:Recombinase n=3 Tax=Flavobacteriaceae TaxID=49546 RepID=A0A223VAL1_9FLAO|nr:MULTISPECIES: site-specific integrase [Flavobacteriaceae]ASV32413.1 recombinase [Maribacter cobaltidurans]MDC6388780.1 site-specific integrase [Maribacter sp. PR1]MEE1976168.1 site-specific integrase [Maribacter cobaltidurans]RIV74335.1 recombinase [Allomuricauda aequoris]TXK08457.1 tyrosine-type recombinase/integrase [Allomuricauda aequoris]
MATIQSFLMKKPNSAGLFPIAIRITKDRRSSYLFTGQYIESKFWDDKFKRVKKSHPNSKRLNSLVAKKIAEANDRLIDNENQNNSQSAKKIKKKIIGKTKMDFFEASKLFLSNLLKRKKFNQHYNQEKRLDIFKTFLGRKKLFFTDLDVTLLKDFKAYLLYDRKVAERTAINYLMLIRTIYNFARKEYHVDDGNYPFGKGKIQIKFPESEKIGLNREEVLLLETANNLTKAQLHAVYAWLTSFYFAGVRVADLIKLKWKDFKDGRLYYRMGKNRKLVSLVVPDKAKEILAYFAAQKTGKDDLVFPFLKGTDLKDEKRVATRVKTITRNLNRRLEIVGEKLGIEKKISMHIARHSFGNISGDKIPIQMLQKLYRHSSITTTVNYQSNFMHKETDDALEKVINF